MGRVSNADLAPVLELEHLMPTAAIQRDRIRPWRLAALLVSETTPLMAASRYSGFVAVWSMAASCDAWLAHRMAMAGSSHRIGGGPKKALLILSMCHKEAFALQVFGTARKRTYHTLEQNRGRHKK